MTTLGRPADYSVEIATEICNLIAAGRSLVSICRDEDGMPNRCTVGRWLEKNEDFRIMYARAREDQADTLADEIVAIADEPPPQTEHGTDSGAVAHQRLRVDARKWVAAKLKPKKYGENATLQADVTHQHYVALIPAQTTNDPMEWAKQVHAERIRNGELPADDPPPTDG